MADQDWKTGGLNRGKYVIHKPCRNCDGAGTVCACPKTGRGIECSCFVGVLCEECDGTGTLPTDEDAKYFVLRIDCGPAGPHDPNARSALLHYVECVRGDNPAFASDILVWLDETGSVVN